MRQNAKGIEDATKETDEYAQVSKNAGTEIATLGQKSAEAARKTEELRYKAEEAEGAIDGIGNKAGKVDVGQAISQGMSGLISVASGINMVTNGIATLTEKLNSGKSSWTDWAAAATSILPGLLSIVGPIVKVIGLILAKGKAAKKSAKDNK